MIPAAVLKPAIVQALGKLHLLLIWRRCQDVEARPRRARFQNGDESHTNNRHDEYQRDRIESISLGNLCGSLCLCGEITSNEIHHRGTEGHRDHTEKTTSNSIPHF